jgi:hypothetical protein
MSGTVTPLPSDRVVRGDTIGLRVLEAKAGGDGIFNPDGTVNIVIQRPGAGRGPGQRIFEAAHLAADCAAGTFVGWPCFDNHDSPIARKARAGLPRPPSELAGVVRETWWDADYVDPELDAKLGYGKGAACATVMPTEPLEALIRRIPEAIKVSVNGLAKNLSRGTWRGREGWVVEGYVNDPEDSSIDFVTTAGAGGQVRRVLEAVGADVRSGSGDPHTPGHEADPGDEEEVVDLKQAIESPEFARVLEAKIDEAIEEKGLVTEEEADKRVQEAVAAQSRVRDLRDHARRRILEAKGIGEAARTDLLERFGVRDSGNGVLEAKAELDVAPEYEGTGDDRTVKKTRVQVLDASLDEAFKRERDRVKEAAPTRVAGQGAGANGTEPGEGEVHSQDSSWLEAARRAGVDVEKAYGVKAPAATT